jgi:hypothetical protein
MAGNKHGVAPGCIIHVAKGVPGTTATVYAAIEWVAQKFNEV